MVNQLINIHIRQLQETADFCRIDNPFWMFMTYSIANLSQRCDLIRPKAVKWSESLQIH
jgi:hypothetical protein